MAIINIFLQFCPPPLSLLKTCSKMKQSLTSTIQLSMIFFVCSEVLYDVTQIWSTINNPFIYVVFINVQEKKRATGWFCHLVFNVLCKVFSLLHHLSELH